MSDRIAEIRERMAEHDGYAPEHRPFHQPSWDDIAFLLAEIERLRMLNQHILNVALEFAPKAYVVSDETLAAAQKRGDHD